MKPYNANDEAIKEALTNRIERYLYESGIPKTRFCQRLNISTTYLYKLLNGERQFSDKITTVFDEYLVKQGY